MADNVKVQISEKNGVDLDFHEEYALTAENIPADNSNGLTDTDIQGQLDELAQTAATSASPGFSFGRGSNVNAGTWLYRPGQVPSNKTGVNFSYTNGSLDVISVGTDDTDTYTLEVYQHEGNLVNPVLIATVSVTAQTRAIFVKDVDYTQTNPLVQNKQIGVLLSLGSARNIGVDLELSGTK